VSTKEKIIIINDLEPFEEEEEERKTQNFYLHVLQNPIKANQTENKRKNF